MTAELRLAGLEELSAGPLRARLLDGLPDFWAGSAVPLTAAEALHDPLFFHQLGGFGTVALTPADEIAGYLLGVVTIDRLAVVHALAVHRAHRRAGVASVLLRRFTGLAAGCGARAAQAVIRPEDDASAALAARFGASSAPSPGHGGPGEDRVVLTRFLPVA